MMIWQMNSGNRSAEAFSKEFSLLFGLNRVISLKNRLKLVDPADNLVFTLVI